MFPVSVRRVVSAEFVVYVLTFLGIHVSTNDENVVFQDAINKEDSSLSLAMKSVSSLTLVVLKLEIIVVLGLLLIVASIILGCIFSMLFRDFMARGPICIPTAPITALTEFFHEDAETNVHSSSVSWYFRSSLRRYLCSCMHIISKLRSVAEAVSSVSRPSLLHLKLRLYSAMILHIIKYFIHWNDCIVKTE